MSKLFISYRRAESNAVSERLFTPLMREFGHRAIFKDVHDIAPGQDFRGVIREATAKCSVMLVVIGPQWASLTDKDGNRRIDDVDDFVRMEVEAGLQRDGVVVIPLLTEDAEMPSPDDLPVSLRELAFNNAMVLRDGPQFDQDLEALIRFLRPIIAPETRAKGIAVGTALAAALVLGLLLIAPRLRDAAGIPASTQTVPAIAAASGSLAAPAVPADGIGIAAAQLPATAQLEQTSGSRSIDWTPVEDNFDGVPMMLVPAGCFNMGSIDEPPIHEQCFDAPFWIDRYEVTNAEYARFIAAGGYDNPDYWTEAGWEWRQAFDMIGPLDSDGFTGSDQPRIGVSWYEAVAYANWRGARLPTEREWEYAARGPDNPMYPWGDILSNDHLVYSDNSNGRSAPVGSRPAGASWIGALDMSGNVQEWTLSVNNPYPYLHTDGRENTDSDANATGRAVRGGSWSVERMFMHAAYRHGIIPEYRNYDTGFRVVRADSR